MISESALLFTGETICDKTGCNSLMLARHHPEAMRSLIFFINLQPNSLISIILKKMFFEILQNKKKYRSPDSLTSPSKELERLTDKKYQKILP